MIEAAALIGFGFLLASLSGLFWYCMGYNAREQKKEDRRK